MASTRFVNPFRPSAPVQSSVAVKGRVRTTTLPAQITTPALGYRTIAKVPNGGRGLAIGYGFEDDVILPGWGLVLTAQAPLTVDLQSARRAAQATADVPLLLIGKGPGCRTVWSVFVANAYHTTVGAAFFDGPLPNGDYNQSLWSHLESLASVRLLVDAPSNGLTGLTTQAPSVADETPSQRIVRLLGSTFGPKSPAMPRAALPVEHLK